MEKTISAAPMYAVNEYGEVRNTVSGRVLTPRKAGYKGASNDSMYIQYRLRSDGKWITRYAHRLVAEAFIPNTEGRDTVDHLDGNKSNNHISNLEWVTKSENVKRALEGGHIYLRWEYLKGTSNRFEEGVTTIPKGSRAKQPEAQSNQSG